MWRGRYVNGDGHPYALGRALIAAYCRAFAGDLPAMTATLIDDHPAGWVTIIRDDPVDPDTPYTREEFAHAEYRFSLPGYGPQCHCHGPYPGTKPVAEAVCDCPVATGMAPCAAAETAWAYGLTPAGLLIAYAPSWTGVHTPVAEVAWDARPDWRIITRNAYDLA